VEVEGGGMAERGENQQAKACDGTAKRESMHGESPDGE
jgi:hypothetical protein